MDYRWLTGREIVDQVNPLCREREWAELNVNEEQPTCRVLGAWESGELVAFFCISLFPVLGPLYVNPPHRTGEVSGELVQRMSEFLGEIEARGYLVVADNPVSAKLARRFGMRKLESPVYVKVGG